jgi:hypothetical protein
MVAVRRPALLLAAPTIEGPGVEMANGKAVEFWLGGYETKAITARIRAATEQALTTKVQVTSTRGGVTKHEMVITP